MTTCRIGDDAVGVERAAIATGMQASPASAAASASRIRADLRMRVIPPSTDDDGPARLVGSAPDSAMDFDLSDEQRLVRDTEREFARAEVAPHAAEVDRTTAVPYAVGAPV